MLFPRLLRPRGGGSAVAAGMSNVGDGGGVRRRATPFSAAAQSTGSPTSTWLCGWPHSDKIGRVSKAVVFRTCLVACFQFCLQTLYEYLLYSLRTTVQVYSVYCDRWDHGRRIKTEEKAKNVAVV